MEIDEIIRKGYSKILWTENNLTINIHELTSLWSISNIKLEIPNTFDSSSNKLIELKSINNNQFQMQIDPKLQFLCFDHVKIHQ